MNSKLYTVRERNTLTRIFCHGMWPLQYKRKVNHTLTREWMLNRKRKSRSRKTLSSKPTNYAGLVWGKTVIIFERSRYRVVLSITKFNRGTENSCPCFTERTGHSATSWFRFCRTPRGEKNIKHSSTVLLLALNVERRWKIYSKMHVMCNNERGRNPLAPLGELPETISPMDFTSIDMWAVPSHPETTSLSFNVHWPFHSVSGSYSAT